MSTWQYLLLFFAVFLGGGLAFFYIRSNTRPVLQMVLSFCGAYVLGITVLHLIPSIYEEPNHLIGLWVLAGFFIQLLLEQFSKGVEHGHMHEPHGTAPPIFAFQIMFGLGVHAFMEGLPLSGFAAFHNLHHAMEHSSNPMFYGVILHKAPEAFALTSLLLISKFKKGGVFLCLIVFSALSPLAAALANWMQFSPEVMAILIALVIGSLLHISTTILFESDPNVNHHIPVKKLLAIALGVGCSMLTLL